MYTDSVYRLYVCIFIAMLKWICKLATFLGFLWFIKWFIDTFYPCLIQYLKETFFLQKTAAEVVVESDNA